MQSGISGVAGAVGTQPITAGATTAGTSAAGARAAAGATSAAGATGAGIAGGTAAGSRAGAGVAGASVAGAAGAATAGASGAAGGGAATFTAVYGDVILASGCGTGAYCHASDAGGKLKMLDQESTYAALVGVKAMGALTPSTSSAAGASGTAGAGGTSSAAGSGAAGASSAGSSGAASSASGAAGSSGGTSPNCVDTGLFRVKAGDPDNSLLVQKLENKQTCGTSMPPGGMLSADQISAVRAWITAGALNN